MSDVPSSALYFVRKFEIPADHAVLIIGPSGEVYPSLAPDGDAGLEANIVAKTLDYVAKKSDPNETIGQIMHQSLIDSGFSEEDAAEAMEARFDPTHEGDGEVH